MAPPDNGFGIHDPDRRGPCAHPIVFSATLLLDHGFYGVAVIRYLQRARYPFLMPVV
jgi:hypothetical protein